MHELSIAQSILVIVRQHLPEDRNREVKSVKLKVGNLSGIVPESLQFCFQMASEGTEMQGARLEIEPVSGDALNVVEVELADEMR